MPDKMFPLEHLLKNLGIPKGRILFLHARLRNIQRVTQRPYDEISREILRLLWKLQPATVLVPAYTIHSFMLTGVYHHLFSKSEVGRFSEEVRQKWAKYRTPDPMYSILDTGDYLANLGKINFLKTFGQNSIFEYLHQKDAIILNLDMEGFWATQVHAVELANNVRYRFKKTFKGVAYWTEKKWQVVQYQAFVRDMAPDGSQSPPYNQVRRKELLESAGVLHTFTCQEMEGAWVSVKDFTKTIDNALKNDQEFLVDPEPDFDLSPWVRTGKRA